MHYFNLNLAFEVLMENLELERLYNPDGRIIVESKEVFSYRLHTHSYYEMILYEPFDGFVAVNGEKIKIDSLTAVIISPLSFHETETVSRSSARFIKVGFTRELLDDMAFEFSLVFEGVEKNGFLHRLFIEILKNAHNEGYLRHLIKCAAFIIQNEGEKIMLFETTKGQSAALKALKIINERFKEALSLPTIAQELSLTPQYLSRSFVSSFGVNFSQYLSIVRLKYAASMIENTNASITDICFESGYCNFSHFSRSFKKQYGTTPREYRRKIKAGR